MFNVLADLHIDFYVKYNNDITYVTKKNTDKINKFSKTKIVRTPEEEDLLEYDSDISKLIDIFFENTKKKFDVLFLAGDIANRNISTLIALKHLSKYWRTIYVCAGNHDYYHQEKLPLDPDSEEYQRQSMIMSDDKIGIVLDRYKDLKLAIEGEELVEDIKCIFTNVDFSGVNILDDTFEDVIKIPNQNSSEQPIRVGINTMFYDIRVPDTRIQFLFMMNDSRFITEEQAKELHEDGIEYYQNVKDKCDIFISHVPLIPKSKREKESPYYVRIPNLNNKIFYLSGHTHFRGELNMNNCRGYSVSAGYPGDTKRFGNVDINDQMRIFAVTQDSSGKFIVEL